MLAGRPAFDANDMHATIHQLLYERPPALESLRPGLPAQLVAQVERAIEHAADARFASANDFAEALLGRAPTENAAHSRPPAATAGAVRRDRRQSDSHVAPQRRRGDSRAPWIAATVVLVLAAAAAWLLATRAPATPAREAAAPHAAATSGNESKTGLTSTTTTPAIPAPAVTGTGGAAPGNAARGAAPATTPTAAPVRRTQGTASTRKPTAAPAFDHKNPYE
jgi:hypothetical protein